MSRSVDLFPRVPWPDFLKAFTWEQGEHVSLVGPTGYGKSTVALELIRRRRYVCILATKPRDVTLDRARRADGYKLIRKWPPPRPASVHPRLILWPKWAGSADTQRQADVIRSAMSQMFADGSWCVYADELAYLVKRLGLRAELEDFWEQGRSLGISLVGCTQRPAWVPLDLYSQADHLVLYKCTDDTDLRRVQGLAGIDPQTIRRQLRQLRKYDFLYIKKSTEQVLISRHPGGH